MPLYEYKCVKCATVFDVLLKLKDIDKEVRCTKCNSTDVVKLISKGVQTKWNCAGLNEDYAIRGNG